MPRPRRALLSTLVVSGLSLAGCLARPYPPNRGDDGAVETTEPSAITPSSSADDRREPVRGEAEPISFDETIEDDEVEYLAEEDEVRIVAAYRHVGTPGDGPPTREPVYEAIPFERWGRTECASVGARRVRDVLADEFGADDAPGTGITSRFGDLAIVVTLETLLDREGEVRYEPSVAFDGVVAVTPSVVDATVRLSNREHRELVPVWVQERTIQET